MELFHNNVFYQWFLLPMFIFLARVCDVSMDTLRIMLLSRNKKLIAPTIGFFQVLIWLFAFRQIVLNLSNPICYIGFAGGFATGTYVGMIIEEKLAIGFQILRIITRKKASRLIEYLQNKGYGVTRVEGEGLSGKVDIIYTIVRRSEIPWLVDTVKEYNPNAFYTIEDVRSISESGVHLIKKEISCHDILNENPSNCDDSS
ncbi:MAG: DUF2179 domain-containing protein [Candidatus Omnitrophica bacterium]|nr:DUF2179 domain-containing protein [Candidatus Omnitrophota bacterium]MBU1997662.1 DUF2179 domain-containing protein [Candidatus Omnitrophota bacterium]